MNEDNYSGFDNGQGFLAEDAVNRYHTQAGVGYDAATFSNTGSSLRAYAEARSQSVLVKSLWLMCGALAVSALFSFIGLAWAVQNPATYIVAMIPCLVLELVVVFVASIAVKKEKVVLAGISFALYAAMNGLTLSIIFFTYDLGSISVIFVITAIMFAALAVYGAKTETDLRPLGSFFLMGLVGIILLGVVNLFLRLEMITNLCAAFGVALFAGITAYDIQKIKNMNIERAGASEMSIAIYGGLELYLDFINIFLKLLQLFGRRK